MTQEHEAQVTKINDFVDFVASVTLAWYVIDYYGGSENLGTVKSFLYGIGVMFVASIVHEILYRILFRSKSRPSRSSSTEQNPNEDQNIDKKE